MRKILINGLFAGSIILIVGMISGQVFQLLVPSLVDEYGNEKIFRPWSDPIMSGMYLQPFLSGIILAWIWTKTQTLFTQINYWERGANFGLIYCLISLPGMLISFTSFQVSLIMIISWTVGILIEGICAGLLFAKFMRQ